MSRKKPISRFKLQRRLMTELPGLGKAGALERKPYPPGQHGQKRIKYSEYRLQLEEKQKIRFHYGLREEQLIRIVKKAKKSQKNWCDSLINLLERRLDNVIFRAGFAQSIAAANQLISHGHILVNGKKVNIRSYTLKINDRIALKQKAVENQTFIYAQHSPRLPLPDWLSILATEQTPTIRLNDEPGLESIPFAFDSYFITSYYSKV